MIYFESSTDEDISQIKEWTHADVYHHNQNNPTWWLTGQGTLSFKLMDEQGVVIYVRIDEGKDYRLNCQFAPTDKVSKRRLILALTEAFPKVIKFVQTTGAESFIFNSTSPALIRFMKWIGFQPVGKDDYRLPFQEGT